MRAGKRSEDLWWYTIFTAAHCALLFWLSVANGAPIRRYRIAGRITDTLNRPLAGVMVRLEDWRGHIVDQARSGTQGQFALAARIASSYILEARKAGFESFTMIVTIGAKSWRPTIIALHSRQPLTLADITAKLNEARNALSPETGSTVYRFTARNINQLPQGDNTPINEVLVQAPGVSQDSYGQGQDEIHVHGLNGGGIQYRLNGIFLPEAVSSFGQLFSAYFVRSMSLITNFMPAQFGYRNEGVVDIHTKDGCLDGGGQIQYFGGQRATIQPSLQYGGCSGDLSYYFSGFYLQNNLGVSSPTTTPDPIHAATQQGQGFAYLSYLVSPTTRLSLIAGTAENFFQIPGQPNLPQMFTLAGASSVPNSDDLDESEFEQNYYGILALQASIGPQFDYQIAYFSRYFSLKYDPDPVGDLVYNGIAASILHTTFINGVQGDSTYRWNDRHTVQAGFYVSRETLEEDNHASVFPLDSMGNPQTVPAGIVDNFNGKALLFGLYAQDQLAPN